MSKQQQNGKAFECALADALEREIDQGGRAALIHDGAYHVTRDALVALGGVAQESCNRAARAAARHIIQLEPMLRAGNRIEIQIQPDHRGQDGDVRDIITARTEGSWAIGFSAKNNHEALKHSRLSPTINFGKKWFSVGCSNEYMDTIRTIFGLVREWKGSGLEVWREVESKESAIYRPVLEAFRKELAGLAERNSAVPGRLVQYLIGMHDFYKVIKDDKSRSVRVVGYNINGALGHGDGKRKSLVGIPRIKLPTRMKEIVVSGNNTVKVSLDEGWEISFRIHNARTELEPSLKFDIKLIGAPANIYAHTAPWWSQSQEPRIRYSRR